MPLCEAAAASIRAIVPPPVARTKQWTSTQRLKRHNYRKPERRGETDRASQWNPE